TSSNKKVATVSAKGVVTGKKKGTAKITIKSGSKSVKVTVRVK
ncbi:MAG: Ig-like domain-containing protein, partial [Clostridium sp.]